MPIEGFKAIWHVSHGMRIEWYSHIDKLYVIMPGIGYKPLASTVEEVISTLGKPVWM